MPLTQRELSYLVERGLQHPGVLYDPGSFFECCERDPEWFDLTEVCYANVLGLALIGKFGNPDAVVEAFKTGDKERLDALVVWQGHEGLNQHFYRFAAHFLDICEPLAYKLEHPPDNITIERIIQRLREEKLSLKCPDLENQLHLGTLTDGSGQQLSV